MRECRCKDWSENIEALLMADYLYAHGFEYAGILIRYCPWCGTVLTNVPPDELDIERLYMLDRNSG